MRQDEVGAVASKDALILSFGRSMCKRFGGDPEQFNYIRGKMRLVGKLLIACFAINILMTSRIGI